MFSFDDECEFIQPKQRSTQTIRDYERIQRRIQYNGDKVRKVSNYIDNYFGTHVTIAILTSLAKIVMGKYKVTLDRLARRNRSALLCWYAENWDIISDILKEKNFKNLIKPLNTIQEQNLVQKKKEISKPAVYDPFDLAVLLNYH